MSSGALQGPAPGPPSNDVPSYRSIEDPVHLRRVLEATLLLEANLDLPTLLDRIVGEARSMTNARYGALGVLNDERTALTEFITVGIDPGLREKIGLPPTGLGVLGLLISDPKPMRLAQIGTHPDRSGFPEHHPPMTSFLGVPIKVRNEVYGNLYLTDKIGWSEFSLDDQELVEALALTAGVAIENANLHRRVQELAVLEERDRLARDLHDTVIQRLFAVGLTLQSLAGSTDGAAVSERLNAAITDIDDTIRQVRTSIFELGSSEVDRGIRSAVISLLRDLNPMVGFDVRVTFDGPVDAVVDGHLFEHLLATIREAVTNIGRHAQATRATVSVSVEEGRCRLIVADNGQGLGERDTRAGGFGLVNMRRRAEKLHGTFEIGGGTAGGTRLTWDVPVVS